MSENREANSFKWFRRRNEKLNFEIVLTGVRPALKVSQDATPTREG